MIHQTEIEIDGVGVMVDVHYSAKRSRGYKAPRRDGVQLEPDEPAGWNIEIVAVKAGQIDLLPLLEGSQQWVDDMARQLAEIESRDADEGDEGEDYDEWRGRRQDYHMSELQESGI